MTELFSQLVYFLWFTFQFKVIRQTFLKIQ